MAADALKPLGRLPENCFFFPNSVKIYKMKKKTTHIKPSKREFDSHLAISLFKYYCRSLY